MNFDHLRRGWVWMIEDKQSYDGHIQGGTRPWVVVSNDDCNKHSPVIHMAPVTSQPKKPLPTHVRFKNEKGMWNTILCEAIRPFNVPDIKGRDMYKVSDDVLNSIGKAIGTQFGCVFTPISYKDVESYYSAMEEFYKSEFDAKLSQMKKDIDSYCSSKIEEVKKSIASSYPPKDNKSVQVNPSTKISNSHGMSQVEKFEKKWGMKSPKVSSPSVETSKTSESVGRKKWDISTIKEMFSVYASEGTKAVQDRYGISVVSLPAMKSNLLKKYKESFTKEEKVEFISDCKKSTVTKVMEKWSLPTKRDVMKFRSSFEVELGE